MGPILAPHRKPPWRANFREGVLHKGYGLAAQGFMLAQGFFIAAQGFIAALGFFAA